jgi:Mg-chelatase subunit ChlI
MTVYPFTALVGLDKVKRLLLMALVNPSLGPVAIIGPPGTGKSTALRGLTELLPPDEFIFACPSNCYAWEDKVCDRCSKVRKDGEVKKVERPIPFVDLPFTASPRELFGYKRKVAPPEPDPWEMYEPGILARANNGILVVEKAEHVPKETLEEVFTALSAGRVVLGTGKRQFTYPFGLTPIMEVDDKELPKGIRHHCRAAARAEPPQSTEEKVLMLKRVQEFDLSPKALVEEHAPAIRALKESIARARTAFTKVHIDEEFIETSRKVAKKAKSPDAWTTLVHVAVANVVLDDAALTTDALEEATAFLPPRKGGA